MTGVHARCPEMLRAGFTVLNSLFPIRPLASRITPNVRTNVRLKLLPIPPCEVDQFAAGVESRCETMTAIWPGDVEEFEPHLELA